jgi:hypoxanthine phosphoribosyltransferase
MAIPEKIKCTVTNWDYIYNLCRDLSLTVVASGYEPDVIVALARGGWFAGRMICDFLGISDLVSLKVEHYVGTAQLGDECIVRYPLAAEMIKGKQALIVDDIADTGKSLQHASVYVKDLKPADCKTSVLQLLFTSEITPDYYAEFLEDWTWVVYPWNFIEDMIDLILKLITKEKKDVWTERLIKVGLSRAFSIDAVHLDIAQPGRLPEVLREMQRRGLLEHKEERWKLK